VAELVVTGLQKIEKTRGVPLTVLKKNQNIGAVEELRRERKICGRRSFRSDYPRRVARGGGNIVAQRRVREITV